MERVAKTGMGGPATTLQLGSTLQVDLANEVQKKDEESGTEVRLQRVVLCLREGVFFARTTRTVRPRATAR